MFSPAAYLAELYKQAKELYPAKNRWHIDERRPDLRLPVRRHCGMGRSQ
ncbi:hypothetical protein PZ739_10865 [Pseudomonas kermanshahensis]|nr:hypothetical protein [Pseudomonas kermanshahensis]WEL58255.1 hypothetical protein PZ739_10865 [Pseudomonas kermanshahensis]